MSEMVSARSPTASYDSANSHSGTADISEAQATSRRVGTTWRGRWPVRNHAAHAASRAAVVAKYSASAAVFALVLVLESIASNNSPNLFTLRCAAKAKRKHR